MTATIYLLPTSSKNDFSKNQLSHSAENHTPVVEGRRIRLVPVRIKPSVRKDFWPCNSPDDFTPTPAA